MKLTKADLNWKKLAFALVFSGVLAGCASEEDSIEVAVLPKVEAKFSLDEIWSERVGKGVGQYYSRLTPVYAYDKIFAASREGDVVALNPETGKPIWEKELGAETSLDISGGLTASYQKIFLGTEKGELIALDADTGELVWRVNVQGEVLSKPLTDESLVIVHTSRGDLAAFDAHSGESRWRISTDVPSLTLRGDSAAVSVGGGVFWGMANGRLAAAFLNNGNLIWQQPIAMPKGATEIDRLVDVDAKPLVSGMTLYSIGYNGSLVAIDLRSGSPIWKRNYSGTNDLVISGDTLYFSNDQDVLYAVDAQSGSERWSNAELKHRQLSAPALIEGYLVVGDAEGYLHWLDTSSGEFVAQQKFKGDGIAVPPVSVEQGFLVITRKGELSMQAIEGTSLTFGESGDSFESYFQSDSQFIE